MKRRRRILEMIYLLGKRDRTAPRYTHTFYYYYGSPPLPRIPFICPHLSYLRINIIIDPKEEAGDEMKSGEEEEEEGAQKLVEFSVSDEVGSDKGGKCE